VAEQAGVVAGRLVHRFGSKHGPLMAMAAATESLRHNIRAVHRRG
jgi:hypothetical protein